MQGSSKLYSYVLVALMGVSALLSLLFFFDVISEGLLLGWCYLLLGAAIAVSIVFPLLVMAKNPKQAKSALIGVIALIVVFVIGYALSGSETYKVGEEIIGEAVSKRSEAGLISFYILIIAAIGSIIYSEVTKAFK